MNVTMRKKVVQQDLSAFSWLLLLFSFFLSSSVSCLVPLTDSLVERAALTDVLALLCVFKTRNRLKHRANLMKKSTLLLFCG